ncbi:cytochrome c biogenesis protein [Thalassoroseus pseudoceratinae]|uniref:cytochrome c biogenesis protein n=1 Tax=Thalassoroseus pseudoceratinae TaxID=2713176 RepID=UPI001423AF45|nr:cytochrome c biogenesis protein CcsA [Thalassoroseus pseudoceratinae]
MSSDAMDSNTNESTQATPAEPRMSGFGSTLHEILTAFASLKLTVALFALAIFIVLAGTLAQTDHGIWTVVSKYFRLETDATFDTTSVSAFTETSWEVITEMVHPKEWFVHVDMKLLFPPSFFAGQGRPELESPTDPVRLGTSILMGFGWMALLLLFMPKSWDWPTKLAVYLPMAIGYTAATAITNGIWFPKGWTVGVVMAFNLLAAHMIRFKVQGRGVAAISGSVLLGIGGLLTAWVINEGSNKDGLSSTGNFGAVEIWNVFLVSLVVIGAIIGYVGARLKTPVWPGRVFCWVIAAGFAATAAVLFVGIDETSVKNNYSGMRILWQLIKATLAAMVLLAGCSLLFKKRAGVVLLHGGIGLMMLSELLVGLSAVEARMTLREGQTLDYVFDIRRFELAVQHDPNEDDEEYNEVVVPEWMIKKSHRTGDTIANEKLPFEFVVKEFYENSDLRTAKPDDKNLATEGVGKQAFSFPMPISTGTDNASMVDMSAVYVDVIDKETKKSRGTWLFSLFLSEPQIIEVDGEQYGVTLRFHRIYKPYSMHLVDVSKTDYIGTNTPRDYRSEVQVYDKTRDLTSTVDIWMNNPLRFGGETFYQSGYDRNPRTGVETTTLQVVENRSWMIPYVSCMIVAVGMLAHFGAILLRFLDRRRREQNLPTMTSTATSAVTPELTKDDGLPTWIRIGVPVVLVVLWAGWLAGKARVPSPEEGQFNYYQFGEIPVVNEGRVKPIDTVARTTMRMLSGRQELIAEIEKDGETEEVRLPATKWLLDLMTLPEEELDHKIIRIDHPQVLTKLDLFERDRHLYSYVELKKKEDIINREVAAAEIIAQKKADEVAKREAKKQLAKAVGKDAKAAAEEAVENAKGDPSPFRSIYHNRLIDLQRRMSIVEERREMLKTVPFTGRMAINNLGLVTNLQDSQMLDTFPMLIFSPTVEKWQPYVLAASRLTLAELVEKDGIEETAREIARESLPQLLTEIEVSKVYDYLEMMRNRAAETVGEQAKQIPLSDLAKFELDRGSFKNIDGEWKQVMEAIVDAGPQGNATTVALKLPDGVVQKIFEEAIDTFPGENRESKIEDAATRMGERAQLLVKAVLRDLPSDSQSGEKSTNVLPRIIAAYEANEPKAFNEAVANYHAVVESKSPELPGKAKGNLDVERTDFEASFNQMAPDFYLMFPYLFAAILAMGAWLGWSRVLNASAFWLIAFTFVLHTLALWGRIYISGRPPVTNLYSSAIFIGWGCVVLGLVFELIWKIGIGNLAAGVAGCTTLWIAHLLTTEVLNEGGDTIKVLQAVLDTGFWLATHVVCITLGYATTYIAGLLGIAYVILGMFTPKLDSRLDRELTRMIYGTIAFSIFFSFVGTVLGGLWADDSWGRFWGWDPKENGALIIVLWNALVLHARWGGLVRDRGLAVLAIAGNIAVSWSWFGVNQLGKGLHSYGFTDGVIKTLFAVIFAHLLLIVAGTVPKTLWWSFAPTDGKPVSEDK